MAALDTLYRNDITYFRQSQSVTSVRLQSGQSIDFRRAGASFPALLNHQAVLAVKTAPGLLWNNAQVQEALGKLLGSTAGKIIALALGIAAAEFWAKTVACDWISGDNGAVLWLRATPPAPGLAFHVSPPQIVRYPSPATAQFCAAIADDLADGEIQVGGATINVGAGALKTLNKAGAKAQSAYAGMVKRGWLKG